MKKNRFIKNIVILAIFAFILCLLHFLVYYFLPSEYKTGGIISMHIFLFVLTCIIYTLRNRIFKTVSVFAGYQFMGTSLGKIIVCCIFLLPELLNQNEKTYPYIFQFLILYFSYLFFEITIMVRDFKSQY